MNYEEKEKGEEKKAPHYSLIFICLKAGHPLYS